MEIAGPKSLMQIPEIDDGERAAISLANQLQADALLVDSHEAGEEAKRIIGTLGVLISTLQRCLCN